MREHFTALFQRSWSFIGLIMLVTYRNARFCESDITIKGLFIPAGMTIEVPVYAMSHDEEYWDDPWEFKPERCDEIF